MLNLPDVNSSFTKVSITNQNAVISRSVGSTGAMGAWAPLNISSGVTNGCQHTVLYIAETIEIL